MCGRLPLTGCNQHNGGIPTNYASQLGSVLKNTDMNTLTIDCGTTNTRATLWVDGHARGSAACELGVKNTAMSGSREPLIAAVKQVIDDTLRQAQLRMEDISLLLASGMISSSLGLLEIPHLPNPVGVQDLAQGMVRAVMYSVCLKPIWFIPGVRNAGDVTSISDGEKIDMMRGEETEAMGLIERLSLRSPTTLILPGSHTKFVNIDAQQRIIGSVTTLAGELLQVLTQHTILADAIEGKFSSHIHPEILLAGAQMCRSVGLSRACFAVRSMQQFLHYEVNDLANFLLGIVVAEDLIALKHSQAIVARSDASVVVAGKPILREALRILVAADTFFEGELIVASDPVQANLAGFGALCIAKARGLYH